MNADDERQMLDALTRWLERDVRPYAHELEKNDEYPEAMVEQMKALGLFGATIPQHDGGLGLPAATYASSARWRPDAKRRACSSRAPRAPTTPASDATWKRGWRNTTCVFQRAVGHQCADARGAGQQRDRRGVPRSGRLGVRVAESRRECERVVPAVLDRVRSGLHRPLRLSDHRR